MSRLAGQAEVVGERETDEHKEVLVNELDWRERISIKPTVCHGKPCIKGTRIMVSIILDYLSAGETREAVRAQYPQVTNEDIQGVLGYAAWLSHEEEQQPLHTEAAG